MEPTELVSRLERGPSDVATRLLRENRGVEGLSEAFFMRVVELSGVDPSASARLADNWDLVRRYGDTAALAYRAKAVGERCRGSWLESARSFRKAAENAGGEVERLSFRIGAVDSLARAGRVEEAVRLGRRLARGLDTLGRPDQAARVRLNVGNALLWQDHYARARGWYEGAIGPLRKAGLEREAAAALLGLSASHLFGGDVRECRAAAEEARAAFDELGDDFHQDLCALTIANTAILAGSPDEAVQILSPLVERLEESAPAEAARALEFMGHAHLALNLFSEAEDGYRSALSHRAMKTLPFNKANCRLGLGMCLSALGRHAEAGKELRSAASAYGRLGNKPWQAASLSALAESYGDRARPQDAGRVAAEAVELLEGIRAPTHSAAARLALARALTGKGEDAESHLKPALRTIRRAGFRHLEWRVHYLRGAASESQRLIHYRKMFRAILDARILATSSVSRAAYLRDKHRALVGYIGCLLDSPTSARVREATRVIAESRSVALLDEILSSMPEPPAEVAERLAAIREELVAEMGDAPGGPSRRGAAPSVAARYQRLWTEASHLVRPIVETKGRHAVHDAFIFTEATDGMDVLHGNRAVRLKIGEEELRADLRRLEFELLAPMVDRDADPAPALRQLERLREKLVEPWLPAGEPVALSPDGMLWSVPWQAMMDIEPALLPSPLFSTAPPTLPSSPKAAIWASDPEDLPHVRREIHAFLQVFPNAKVVSCAGEARAMLNSGETWDLLHVAGHARAPASFEDNPMFASLEMSDGPVLAAEVAQARARFGLVVLSACDTGRVSLWSRHEPDGLVRAFLARGAGAVIAGLWPLDDAAAEVMAREFYRGLTAGGTVSESLATARHACRSIYPHPYFWAPQALFSGYNRGDLS